VATSYQQTDTAAQDGSIAACSGATVGGTVANSKISVGGSPGTATPTIGLTGNQTRALAFMETAAGVPGLTSWPAGNYTYRLNLPNGSANALMVWDALYLCRLNSAGVNQGTVGSATGQNLSCANPGVLSMTVSGAAQASTNVGDVLYAVFVFKVVGVTGDNVQVKFDQLVDTPFGATPPGLSVAVVAAESPIVRDIQQAIVQRGVVPVPLVKPPPAFVGPVEVPAMLLLNQGGYGLFWGRPPVPLVKPPLPVLAIAGEVPRAELVMQGAVIPDGNSNLAPLAGPNVKPPLPVIASLLEVPRGELLVQGSNIPDMNSLAQGVGLPPTPTNVVLRSRYGVEPENPRRELLMQGGVIYLGRSSIVPVPVPVVPPVSIFASSFAISGEVPAWQRLIEGSATYSTVRMPFPWPHIQVTALQESPAGQSLMSGALVAFWSRPPVPLAPAPPYPRLGTESPAWQALLMPGVAIISNTSANAPTATPIILPGKPVVAGPLDLPVNMLLAFGVGMRAAGWGPIPVVPVIVATTEFPGRELYATGSARAQSGAVPVQTVKPAQTVAYAALQESPAGQVLVQGSVASSAARASIPWLRTVFIAVLETPAAGQLVQGSVASFLGVVPVPIVPTRRAVLGTDSETPAQQFLREPQARSLPSPQQYAVPTSTPHATPVTRSEHPDPAAAAIQPGYVVSIRGVFPGVTISPTRAVIAVQSETPAQQLLREGSGKASIVPAPYTTTPVAAPTKAVVARGDLFGEIQLVQGQAIRFVGLVSVPVKPSPRAVVASIGEQFLPGPGAATWSVPIVPPGPATARVARFDMGPHEAQLAAGSVQTSRLYVSVPIVQPGKPLRVDSESFASAVEGRAIVAQSRVPQFSPPPRPRIVSQIDVPFDQGSAWAAPVKVIQILVTILTPAVTFADNANGTVTATVTGSSPGSVNNIFVQYADGNILKPYFAAEGTVTGDGAITFTLPASVYWGECISTLAGPQIVVVPTVWFSATSGLPGMHERCVQAAITRLKQLTFSGTPASPGTITKIVDSLVPFDDIGSTLPRLLVTLENLAETVGAPGDSPYGGSNYRDDYGWPVHVWILDQQNMGSLANQRARRLKYTKWREQIQRAFSRQRLAGVSDVFDCQVFPDIIAAGDLPLRNYFMSGITLRFFTRLTRGITS
jgi:hypothetical protein